MTHDPSQTSDADRAVWRLSRLIDELGLYRVLLALRFICARKARELDDVDDVPAYGWRTAGRKIDFAAFWAANWPENEQGARMNKRPTPDIASLVKREGLDAVLLALRHYCAVTSQLCPDHHFSLWQYAARGIDRVAEDWHEACKQLKSQGKDAPCSEPTPSAPAATPGS